MSTPYEQNFVVTSTSNDQVFGLPYPGRCFIDRIAVVATVTAAVKFFNRAFVSPAVRLKKVNGNAITVVGFHGARVGDSLSRGTFDADGTYAAAVTNLVVTQVLNEHELVLNTTVGVDPDDGNSYGVQAFVPTAIEGLYAVGPASTALTANTLAELAAVGSFINMDPTSNYSAMSNRMLYVRTSLPGTYRINVRSRSTSNQY